MHPETKLSVMGGSVKGPDFTTVVIQYEHDAAAGTGSDPFPYNAKSSEQTPEILQCKISDGKLNEISWMPMENKPNRKGLIRYVKKNEFSQ